MARFRVSIASDGKNGGPENRQNGEARETKKGTLRSGICDGILQLHDGFKVMACREIELGGKWTEGIQPHPTALPPKTRAKNIQADRVDIGPRLP